MSEPIDIKKQEFSFFGKGSTINGTFYLKGTTHLSSQVEGEIYVEDNSPLIIEDEGFFSGTLKGHNIDIHGRFEGTLSASGKVVLHPTAVVSGNIRADQLVVHPGSIVSVEAATES